jgi:hypothetical protein
MKCALGLLGSRKLSLRKRQHGENESDLLSSLKFEFCLLCLAVTVIVSFAAVSELVLSLRCNTTNGVVEKRLMDDAE